MKYSINSLLYFVLPILLLFAVSQSCKKSEADLPTLSINKSISIAEGNIGYTDVQIDITLSGAAENDVIVELSSEDGTAKSGEDFLGFSDTLFTFGSGETTKTLNVKLIADVDFEENKVFYVKVAGVKNALLGDSRTEITIENDDQFVPVVYFDSITKQNEGNNPVQTASLNFKLSGIAESPVRITYRTVALTAKPGIDYTEIESEMVEIAAGEFEKRVYFTFLGDENFELDDAFKIEFTAVEGATMQHQSAIVKIVNDDTYTPELVSDGYITPNQYPDMELVWSDEFDGTSVNTNNWTFETGGGGWGNNELQIYTSLSQNSFVSGGKLNIVATKQNNAYYSARLISKGKQEFTYGRIDFRAKITYGKGVWPALWMLGGNISSIGWPRCGEIDIMENIGDELTRVHGTVHYNDGGHQYKGDYYQLANNQNFYEQFHVFSIVWQEDGIRWFVDYQPYYYVSSTNIAYEAFRLPQFFIMNVAVGGNWPGDPNASTTFPQTMQVDYVRVFK